MLKIVNYSSHKYLSNIEKHPTTLLYTNRGKRVSTIDGLFVNKTFVPPVFHTFLQTLALVIFLLNHITTLRSANIMIGLQHVRISLKVYDIYLKHFLLVHCMSRRLEWHEWIYFFVDDKYRLSCPFQVGHWSNVKNPFIQSRPSSKGNCNLQVQIWKCI